MVIILLILITLSVDSVWMLLGENCCWSLLALKGLNVITQHHSLFGEKHLHDNPKMLEGSGGAVSQ